MGVDDDFEGIAARTFSLMRARMIAHDADNELFKATLAKAVEAGIFKGRLTAIIDSSPVNGAGAVADSYELIRGFLRQAARAAGGRLSPAARATAEPFCGAKPDIDWQDPAARRAHLGELVGAARTVMAALDGVDDPAVAEPVGLLGQVIDADTEPDPDPDGGGDGGVRIRQGVAPDRVISVSDPQMRHGRKSSARRFDGHKMDIITDETSELVLGVDIRAGNAADGEGAIPLLDVVRSLPGIDVEVLVGDMAYSDGDIRAGIEARGMEMVAKVPPVTNAGRYPKTDFYIHLDAREVTCPAGEVTADATPGTDHKAGPGCSSASTRPSVPPARCGPTAPPPPAGAASLSASTTIASPPPGPPRRTHRSGPCCATGPKWNARSTTSRTWACAKPATEDDPKPNIKAFWPPPSPTSVALTSSASSANPPTPSWPPDPQHFLAAPPPNHPTAALTPSPTHHNASRGQNRPARHRPPCQPQTGTSCRLS